MQKSYLAKSPINFVQVSFRVNTGDILVHDTMNQRLTVYRGGEIVKTMNQSSLGMMALLKDRFAEEIVEHRPTKPVPQPIDPAECQRMLKNTPKITPNPKPPIVIKPTQEELRAKRKKAVAKEVSTDDPTFRERMGLKDGESIEDPAVRKRLGLTPKD